MKEVSALQLPKGHLLTVGKCQLESIAVVMVHEFLGLESHCFF